VLYKETSLKISWLSFHIWRCFLHSHAPLSLLSLTNDEIKQCLQLVQAHQTPQALARRARIVLTIHDHPDWSSQRIAELVGCNDRLVRKWRRRWQEAHSLDFLTQIRCTTSLFLPGASPSDSTRLQSASLSWRPPGSLESSRTGSPCHHHPNFTDHFGQNDWEVAHC